jgi:hypothetical protein
VAWLWLDQSVVMRFLLVLNNTGRGEGCPYSELNPWFQHTSGHVGHRIHSYYYGNAWAYIEPTLFSAQMTVVAFRCLTFLTMRLNCCYILIEYVALTVCWIFRSLIYRFRDWLSECSTWQVCRVCPSHFRSIILVHEVLGFFVASFIRTSKRSKEDGINGEYVAYTPILKCSEVEIFLFPIQ